MSTTCNTEESCTTTCIKGNPHDGNHLLISLIFKSKLPNNSYRNHYYRQISIVVDGNICHGGFKVVITDKA